MSYINTNHIDVKRGKLTFKVGEEEIEFILAKLLKSHSLRDSCCLVDLITNCIQESTLKPSPTNKLEDFILGNPKVEKDGTKAKVYGEILNESTIPANKALKHIL